MLGRIYLITNVANNKGYVGVTTKTLKKRFQQHCWDGQRRTRLVIHHAIKKYGKANFKIELLEELPDTTEEALFLREAHYIKEYDTLIDNGRGYNMAEYGGGKLTYSEATRKKMSELKGEKNHNADLTIRQFRNVNTGETFSGHRYEFVKKFNLIKDGIDRLIRGYRKSSCGWVVCEA